jgi:hypothetical protein
VVPKKGHPLNTIISLSTHQNLLSIAPAVGVQTGQGEKQDSIREIFDTDQFSRLGVREQITFPLLLFLSVQAWLTNRSRHRTPEVPQRRQ